MTAGKIQCAIKTTEHGQSLCPAKSPKMTKAYVSSTRFHPKSNQLFLVLKDCYLW